MEIKRNILLNPGPATTTDTVKMAQVIYSVRQALLEHFAEGEENKWARHCRVFQAIRKGLSDLYFRGE